jgi:hypothetical protein
MSRWSAYRLSAHAPTLGAAVACTAAAAAAAAVVVVSGTLLAGPASAGTPGMSIKVTPNRGLVNGQLVTVSGRGLIRAAGATGVTWFVTECTAAVHGRVNPATDTPHCDVTDAQGIRVSRNGSFSTKFRVHAGIVGDGYCGTTDHASCVVGLGTAKGQGTVAKITFATTSGTTGA